MNSASAIAAVGKVAGLGGLVLLFVFSVVKLFLDKRSRHIHDGLDRGDRYKVLRLLIVGTFLVAMTGLIVWLVAEIAGTQLAENNKRKLAVIDSLGSLSSQATSLVQSIYIAQQRPKSTSPDSYAAQLSPANILALAAAPQLSQVSPDFQVCLVHLTANLNAIYAHMIPLLAYPPRTKILNVYSAHTQAIVNLSAIELDFQKSNITEEVRSRRLNETIHAEPKPCSVIAALPGSLEHEQQYSYRQLELKYIPILRNTICRESLKEFVQSVHSATELDGVNAIQVATARVKAACVPDARILLEALRAQNGAEPAILNNENAIVQPALKYRQCVLDALWHIERNEAVDCVNQGVEVMCPVSQPSEDFLLLTNNWKTAPKALCP